MVLGEAQIGLRDSGQSIAGRAGARVSSPKGADEFFEAFDRHRIGDLFHATEVPVQDRLAVLDLRRQPARGHRIPAFCLGQGAGRGDDQLTTGGPLTLPTILDGHARPYHSY
jgi:hypothetical protein